MNCYRITTSDGNIFTYTEEEMKMYMPPQNSKIETIQCKAKDGGNFIPKEVLIIGGVLLAVLLLSNQK